MNVAIVVATCGAQGWAELAWARAYPSAQQLDKDGRAPEIVVAHYPALSVCEARNAAFRDHVGDAEWVCFLDADDELEDGYLAAMAAAVWANPAGVWEDDHHYDELREVPPLFVPAVRYFGPPGSSGVPHIPNRGRWPELNECVIGTIVRRDLFEHLGGFRSQTDDGTELTLYEDWDLFLRCYDAGAELVHVEGAVYRAYVNPHGLGRNQGPNARPVYDAIWADHRRRIGAPSG